MSNQEISFKDKDIETKEKMVRGSIWMTSGSVISRLIGVIYILPWYAWMGENGRVANALFNKGYNVYALFLMIATAGIPSAVAKQISHYNSLNEYGISKRLFKRSMMLMAICGVLFASIMFFAAPVLADGNADLIPVMRSLSWAVLIFPCMSVIRGFFQGYHDMMPSAVSQIIEQIARVFYMLLATFIIMKVSSGDYVKAVTQSTFAAFIGAVVAVAALCWYYYKQKPMMDELVENSSNDIEISENSLLKDIIIEAIPFIIVGSGINIFKLVDQFTFERFMSGFTHYSDKQLEALFSVFSANPDKLVMIIISLATALAATGLPLITAAFTEKNKKGLAKLVSENIQLFFFIMIPATFGLIVLAEPMNTLFYGHDVLGYKVLIEASYVGLLMGFFMLISTTLQGLYKHSEAILYLGVGVAVKIILQYPAVRLFEVYGPLLSSAAGFLITCYLMLKSVHTLTRFNLSLTARRTLLIFIFSLVMVIGTWLMRSFLYLFLSPASKIQSFIIILLVVAVGVAIYGFLSLKVRLADKLLGNKVSHIRRKLKIS
ncbi:putative polysaccharide biosynthesis protein [Vagococcus acidifermentans]|uniref:Polysaccharide biosynthesis protein n=1 Tax=Vagococcus acidifermentans TaxID=564710 RepID=A0A430AUV0_9ENTE|nr:polysaccharide biosynthesis protein [Vagococcus acidifermentans]RSU11829.1 polysaccharide biosynthesis protein [Vagococcus acidifermentans]